MNEWGMACLHLLCNSGEGSEAVNYYGLAAESMHVVCVATSKAGMVRAAL